uniref:Uncharacterized protein n=1 Tax=Cucumis melo TaxID=3656 RepID=A0A9I9CVY9_CUCME
MSPMNYCICFGAQKKKKSNNQTDGHKGGRKFRPPRGHGGRAAGGGSGAGNGNLAVLTDHDGGVALAATTLGFAVAAAALVDAGEHGGSCGGGECGGGGCGGG